MDNKITYGLIGLGVVGAGVGGYFLWKWYQNQMKISPDQEIFDKYIKEGGGVAATETKPVTAKGQALIDALNNVKEYTGVGVTSQGRVLAFADEAYKKINPDVQSKYPDKNGSLYFYTHAGYKEELTNPKRQAIFIDTKTGELFKIDDADYKARMKDVASDKKYGSLNSAVHFIEKGQAEKRQANLIPFKA